MNAARQVHGRFKFIGSVVGIIVVLIFLALLFPRLITGHGLGLWAFASSKVQLLSSLSLAVLKSQSIQNYSHGRFTNVIFLHHSTGSNLIEQGGIRELLTKADYSFWDHGYNSEGLRQPDANSAGYSYNIPADNTDPDGLASIFAQQVYDLPLNAFSGLLQHEVIAFKSCFPVSDITSAEQLARYQSYYLAMRDVMDQHPDKVFIVVTPPPLNPAETNAEAAARARIFANWLTSDEYLRGHPNIFTFNFFGYLAEDDPALSDYNMLPIC